MAVKDLQEVLSAVALNNGFNLKGEPVEDVHEPGKYYQNIIAGAEFSSGSSSAMSIARRMRDAALAFGFNVSFIVLARDVNELEEAFRATIISKYPTDVYACNLIGDINGVSALVTCLISQELKEKLLKDIAIFFRAANLNLQSVNFVDYNLTPKPYVIISTIRKWSPLLIGDLRQRLLGAGFSMPNDDLLNKHLDNLRKKRLVERNTSGQYFLTYEGLKLLGTDLGRGSADVHRALDLARKLL